MRRKVFKSAIMMVLLGGFSFLTSCSNDADDVIVTPTDEIELQLQQMTLREKVGQMFYVRPE